MSKEIQNILLIGFGPHSQRIYYPIFKNDGDEIGFRLVYGVDTESKKDEIKTYLKKQNDGQMQMYFVPDKQKSISSLPNNIIKELDRIVLEYNVKGVIIATDPLYHMVYARWALQKGLSILLDKPISIRKKASICQKAAMGIIDDYLELAELYKEVKNKNNRILCSVMVQRRYHPVFHKVNELIKEVSDKTNCPITSIQSFHCDGQWRLPSEIIDETYHSYNDGYGKCSHSGYHFFDIAQWLLSSNEISGKEIDSVDIFSRFTRPNDYFSQLTLDDYRLFFPDFGSYNQYSESTLKQKCKDHGEIDAFNSFAFKSRGKTITIGSINLCHNGFSQRGWPQLNSNDLYKGNGRLRHEYHIIEQGPFQTISLQSLQSKEVDPNQNVHLFEPGGEFHFDIQIFRNNTLFSNWNAYQRISIEELDKLHMKGKSRGHQEDAKLASVTEFIQFLNGSISTCESDLLNHYRSVQLMSGVYISAARQHKSLTGNVNLQFGNLPIGVN